MYTKATEVGGKNTSQMNLLKKASDRPKIEILLINHL